MTQQRLYVRVLVAVAAAALTGGAGWLFSLSLPETFILSVFVAGVVLVVQLLNQFDQQLIAMQAVVTGRFSEVSDATRLFGQVGASALRGEVRQLAESSLHVGHASPPLVLDLARSQVERMSDFLQQLGGRHEVVYDNGEDRDWLLALTVLTRDTMDATSHGSVGADGQFVDEGLWATELGQRYLVAQGRAIREHGVAIRRVFVLERAALASDPVFRKICQEQIELGIQVRAVELTKLPRAGGTFVADFILFDDQISYESTTNPRQPLGPMFVKTSLVLDDKRISQQRQRFDELWAAPDELESEAT